MAIAVSVSPKEFYVGYLNKNQVRMVTTESFTSRDDALKFARALYQLDCTDIEIITKEKVIAV